VRLLADRRGEAVDADRAAVELVDYRGQDRAVHLVEAARVDIEQLQRRKRDFARYDPRLVDLGEVAHPAQQAVDDARRAARARGEFARAVLVVFDFEQPGRTADDLRQLLMIVELEMKLLAETVAQR